MTSPAQPREIRTLFVDDDDSSNKRAQISELASFGINGRLLHPEEIEDEDLNWAHIVVVDYFLTHWEERNAIHSPARRPFDGIAAIASMRSSLLPDLDERGRGAPLRPVAFALLSSHLSEASFDLPASVVGHVFARENGIEWAFGRSEIGTRLFGTQLADLGAAVQHLTDGLPWNADAAPNELDRLLGLVEGRGGEPPARWIDQARDEVLACHPPIHELGARTHGQVMLRWLLHRVLPYPTFLINEQQLCARLRVDALAAGGAPHPSHLETALKQVEYTGALRHFGGRRWWRAGVEDWLYRETKGNSGATDTVSSLATSLGAQRSTEWRHPVVVIDETLAARAKFEEVDQVVRVLPDDWPVYADSAYAAISDVLSSDFLRSLVAPDDRDIVEEELLARSLPTQKIVSNEHVNEC